MDAKASAREHLVERDAVRPVRVARQQMVLDRVREAARAGTVVRLHDAVRDERAVERDDGVASARERVVAEPHAVQDRPRHERQSSRCEERSRPSRALAPRAGNDERKGGEDEQQRVSRADERAQRDTRTGEREPAHRGADGCAREEQRPAGEGRGEERVARELVEHEPVRGVDEEGGYDEERRTSAERPCGDRPRDDRAREEHAHQRLGEETARDVERDAGEDRHRGRAEEHRPRQQRVPVEELDVAVDVLVEVATCLQRPADRLHRVHGEGDPEENDRAEPSAREPLEPDERAPQAVSDVGGQAAAGLRRRWMSWRPSSAAGRNETRSKPAASVRWT